MQKSDPERPRRSRLFDWVPPALLAAAFVAMYRWTWLRWPDLIIDFGREIYAPWQIAEGKVLYRDLAWFNGPFSAYFNASVFRLFGAHLRTLVWANAAWTALLLVLLYAILRRTAGRLSALVGCLLAVGLFCFGNLLDKGNYNFICPYAHELTHGLVLSLAALYALDRFHRQRAPRWLLASAGALGLVLLTKIEVIAALLPAYAVAVVVGSRERTARSEEAPGPAWTGALRVAWSAAVAFPLLLAIALFAPAMPFADALRAGTGAFFALGRMEVAGLALYREGMGLLDPGASVGALVRWTAGYLAVLAPAAALALGAGRVTRRRRNPRSGEVRESSRPPNPRATPGSSRTVALRSSWAPWVLSFAVFGLVGAILAWDWTSIRWNEAARPLPLVLLACLAWVATDLVVVHAGGKAAIDPRGRPAAGLRLGFTVFALLLLLKMILNARIQGYGFALALPATVALVACWLDWIPRRIERRGGIGWIFRAAALAMLAVYSAVSLTVIDYWLRSKQEPVGTGPDRFYTDARGEVVRQTLAALSQQIAPGETLLELPEGIMLNVLLRREAPTAYLNFMPPELFFFGEERMVDALEARPPDYIALVDRPTHEYGLPYFGTHYGRSLAAWVRAEYSPWMGFGRQPLRNEGFGILVLRRAGSDR